MIVKLPAPDYGWIGHDDMKGPSLMFSRFACFHTHGNRVDWGKRLEPHLLGGNLSIGIKRP